MVRNTSSVLPHLDCCLTVQIIRVFIAVRFFILVCTQEPTDAPSFYQVATLSLSHLLTAARARVTPIQIDAPFVL
jgi:hypothetical protein